MEVRGIVDVGILFFLEANNCLGHLFSLANILETALLTNLFSTGLQ